ncbi:MAG: DUF2339 domain-containing protein, partial [Candidatus Hydrogenedentes bacterium]|nr:DUF2339 domain-containing protein [Candidatus Hydrogenedentota bacterium]
MEIVGLLVLGFAGVVVGGSICGIIAVVRTHSMRIDLEQLQRKVHCLESRVWADPERKTSQQKEGAAETAAGSPPPISVQKEVPPVSAPVAGKDTPPLPPVPAASTPPASAQAAAPLSFEMRLGTRWIIWLGAAIFLGGVALALKYSYDNSMIGPNGRMVMGVLTGVIALFAGEYFERRKRVIPFQVFTGGGLAIFYLCIFFAFQIYHLTGSGFAMLLAVIVTVLAVSLSVLHNAMPIAMLAVLGGYLSPVFLSTGENAPWQLFSYVAVLNMVALGAGYFRRWRMLDLFCFAGTAFLYLGWYEKFYSYPGQVAPALIFITLFYMMFMIVPVLYSLVRGIPEGLQSLTLIMGNSLFWLFCYYSILFEAHREALGLVALMQALFVFLLYNLWTRRVKDPTPTAQSLLVISLSLLTLVIPLWLHFYAVPLAWAVEGVVLLWLSFRFRNRLARLGGVLA